MYIKKLISGIICFFFLVLTAPAAHAGSPVWKVSQGNRHLYIGGTIHILGESDYPLPTAFDKAYGKSDTLVFETDIQKSRDPEFTKAFLAKMVYSDNRTLQQLIEPDTFQDFKIFTADRGIPVEAMNKFKPGLVLITLTMIEVERLGVSGTGVDEFYYVKAGKDNKRMLYLESLEEQVSFVENLGKGNENELIAYILKDLENLPSLLNVMKTSWKTGDNQTFDKAVIAPLKKDFPDLYQSIIVQRNLNWLPRIKAMAATPEVEFILVGAAHLAGKNGLLALFRKQGFLIKNQ
jgi:uncharacterized protein YbaP (TraB family)